MNISLTSKLFAFLESELSALLITILLGTITTLCIIFVQVGILDYSNLSWSFNLEWNGYVFLTLLLSPLIYLAFALLSPLYVILFGFLLGLITLTFDGVMKLLCNKLTISILILASIISIYIYSVGNSIEEKNNHKTKTEDTTSLVEMLEKQ